MHAHIVRSMLPSCSACCERDAKAAATVAGNEQGVANYYQSNGHGAALDRPSSFDRSLQSIDMKSHVEFGSA